MSIDAVRIKCTPWCLEADGHPNETGRADQNCLGYDTYVDLKLEEIDQDSYYGPYTSRFGLTPYRRFNQPPSVYFHIDLIDHERGNIDREVHLTAAEARELAAALLTVADTIERVV